MNSTETKTELLTCANLFTEEVGGATTQCNSDTRLRLFNSENKEVFNESLLTITALRKRLEAVEKERDDFRHDVSTAATLANERGDRILELKKANGELVELVQRAMLNTRSDAILLGRLGLGDPEHVKETQWWKDAEKATAEAMKGEG